MLGRDHLGSVASDAKFVDHTSIIGTLIDQWELKSGNKSYLTPRDAGARRLEGFLDASYRNPFDPSQLPILHCTVPTNEDLGRGEFERHPYAEDSNSLNTMIDRLLINPEVEERIRGQQGY